MYIGDILREKKTPKSPSRRLFRQQLLQCLSPLRCVRMAHRSFILRLRFMGDLWASLWICTGCKAWKMVKPLCNSGVLMLVKQLKKLYHPDGLIWIDGTNITHNNGKFGDGGSYCFTKIIAGLPWKIVIQWDMNGDMSWFITGYN